MEERVSDHRNQTTSAIRNHHISTKHPKAELKDFTIIDRERATPYTVEQKKHFTFISNIITQLEHWQSQNPFSIQKCIKLSRQLELPHSSIPHQRGALLHLVFQHKRQLTLHTFFISIYNRSVIPMFTPFKLQDN